MAISILCNAQANDAQAFNYIAKESATIAELEAVKDKTLREDGIMPFIKTYKDFLDDTKEWNTGSEPFKEFIKKFITDKNFRDERIVLSQEQLEVYKQNEHSYYFSMDIKNQKEGVPFAAWTEISAEEAHFMNGWVLGEAIDSSTFNRSGGLWYLTDYVIFSYDEEEE